MKQKRRLLLGVNLYLPGNHMSAFVHKDNQTHRLLDIDFYKEVAEISEKGKFDFVFIPDILKIWPDTLGNIPRPAPVYLEPFTLLSAVAAVTEKIGLVATVSTTYNEPFHLARKFATIDHLSKGRIAWNIVTSVSDDEAHNFSKESHLRHDLRYKRAKEFLEVTKQLWESWVDEDFENQKTNFPNPNTAKEINFKGEWFSIKGPLTVPRPIQGKPVLLQAGSSPAGREFGVSEADIIFTVAPTLETAKAFYDDTKARAIKYGRKPEEIKIISGVALYVAETEEKAWEKKNYLDSLVPINFALDYFSLQIKKDVRQYKLTDSIRTVLDQLEDGEGDITNSKIRVFKMMAEKQDYTVEQFVKFVAGARGHREIIGTPAQIADELQQWFDEGAIDGYNIYPPIFNSELEAIVELVIPELQKRGLVQLDYEGKHFRERIQSSNVKKELLV